MGVIQNKYGSSYFNEDERYSVTAQNSIIDRVQMNDF